MIKLNGKEKEYSDISISELLEAEGYGSLRVAVELNGEIIRKNTFSEIILKAGDVVEVVSFVGGGWY